MVVQTSGASLCVCLSRSETESLMNHANDAQVCVVCCLTWWLFHLRSWVICKPQMRNVWIVGAGLTYEIRWLLLSTISSFVAYLMGPIVCSKLMDENGTISCARGHIVSVLPPSSPSSLGCVTVPFRYTVSENHGMIKPFQSLLS